MKTKGSRNKKGVKRFLNKWGYYEIFEPSHPLAKKNGYIREHRMIAYKFGLLKDPKDEVHHINGIKTDNRVENLQVLSKPEHTSISMKGKKKKPMSDKLRKEISERMKGNKNWAGREVIGNVYMNKELLT